VLVARVDDDIFYANTEAVKDQLLADVEQAATPVRLVVLDLADTPFLDLAGIDMIEATSDELRDRGAVLRVAGANGEVRDALRKAGVDAKIGPLAQRDTIEQVVDDWLAHPQTTAAAASAAPVASASPGRQED
jgi:MFS superfamily sulfate permease-like transporter